MLRRTIASTLLLILQTHTQWQSIYNPKRADYTNKCWQENSPPKPKSKCVFCNELAQNKDGVNFIIKRFKHVYLCLNLFPYRHGHMLVLPIEHVANLDELAPEARAELMEVTSMAVTALKKAFNTHGTNVGINIGKAAGASKPDYLHVQIVPRWHDDTNWIHIIGQTGVITQDMQEVYKTLKTKIDEIS